ncbi:hypothetical protein L6V77_06115 [Myxococcota bacterium]|nr:hypothetical protein [Myxococcota bacterium]
MSPTAPEQDALVLVRNRRYVVRGVAVSELGADVSAAVSEHRRQHLLHLRAIDDDAGRDKTVETGLVIQELLLRHQAGNVLVVCPAGLQLQWRDPFGLDLLVVDEVHDVVDAAGGTSLRASTIAALAPPGGHRRRDRPRDGAHRAALRLARMAGVPECGHVPRAGAVGAVGSSFCHPPTNTSMRRAPRRQRCEAAFNGSAVVIPALNNLNPLFLASAGHAVHQTVLARDSARPEA